MSTHESSTEGAAQHGAAERGVIYFDGIEIRDIQIYLPIQESFNLAGMNEYEKYSEDTYFKTVKDLSDDMESSELEIE